MSNIVNQMTDGPKETGNGPWQRRRRASIAGIIFFGVIVLSDASRAQQNSSPAGQTINAFELSKLQDLQQGSQLLVNQGRLKQASNQLRRIVDQFPQIPGNHYLLALVLAKQNKFDAAFDRLTVAIRKGFRSVELIQSDPVFAPLRQQGRFQSLIDMMGEPASEAGAIRVQKVSPALVRKGIVPVNEGNTAWDSKLRILKSSIRFNSKEAPPGEVQKGKGALQQLNDWYSRGLAAGNTGDLYDNHDRNHSGGLFGKSFPQMAIVKYGTNAVKLGVDYGFNSRMFFNAITIGNSSTVAAGRSQVRHALTLPGIPEILFLQYANNHLYVYPEHRDYDPGRGDMLPANTPYVIVVQGSSKSDQPILRALASILAAFKPDVKDHLRKNLLVMPTVQMIFRRGQKPVITDADYLSARAHPPVFRPENIDLKKMIGLANQLKIEDVPPMVRLKVIQESGPVPGIDDFSLRLSETLFNTPGAIARIVRSTAYEKRMIVRVEKSRSETNKKLKLHWVVLSGDAERIKINPRNEDGSEVELVVPWHKRRPVPGNPGMTTDRIEIGVFVEKGKTYSAPAIINFLYPPNQTREYNEQGQILSIDHQSPKFDRKSLEPRLFVQRDWKDIYRYDENSKLTGWQRKRGKWFDNYFRDGAKITEWDDQDRPIKARIVGYFLEIKNKKLPVMIEKATDKILRYRYDGKQDFVGEHYSD